MSDADTVDYNHSPAREETDDDDELNLDSCTKRKRILSDSDEESDIGEKKTGKFKRVR